MTSHSDTSSGMRHALSAHVLWGSMPLYLLLVRAVPPIEYVAWRILFTVPLCLAIITWRGNLHEIHRAITDGKSLLALVGCSAMIGINWTVYVWAIQSGQVYAASLGYYILPLLMMLLGLVLLNEKLTQRQWGAVILAGIGVAMLAAGALTTLWLSLSLSFTFAIYGLLKKKTATGALTGLTVESMLLVPVAIGIAAWYATTPGGIALGRAPLESLAIVLGAPMTAVPLILFAKAARRLPYTALGFLQFVSPTIVFLIGLVVFREELRPIQLFSFIAIWAGAALFIHDMLKNRDRSSQKPIQQSTNNKPAFTDEAP